MDNEYVCVDDAQAAAFFASVSRQVIDLLKGWKEEFCDCDKFSRIVQSIALAAHATQWAATQSKPAGLTLGVINYLRSNNKGGHSINFIITKVNDKEEFNIRFFEPQTAREVKLETEEIKKAFVILL
jgi:hypothetical protein